ncbi:RNHCP domain-containing protein [Alicyclobacillus tolerans]|uniref:DNA-directed RNA polymerase subunit RPC12/RpoP n=1 Tax=Alicyclobacillus tolerans TaxID=90970 RepID=A0ABT9LWQ0_9BACL|nr:RNHCP domain-containing protein [Alicyclobacillus tengchongensis]MDP9728695.1 DNA-directed RNA polymerase subunit RPC12/RpoP [Alicyclobacillus tengchongensis]
MQHARFTHRNEGFICAHCGVDVPPSTSTCRNHCPNCLYSVHLDNFPGDRAANCRGLMEPIEIIQHSKKGWQVVHRCQRCGHESRNTLHFDDPLAADSFNRALELMRKGPSI